MFLGFSENTDPSLKQGEKFNRIMQVFNQMVDPQLKIIEMGSPNVLEGLENSNSGGDSATTNTNGRALLQSISDNELSTLNDLETKFDNKLSQYKNAFQDYLTDLTNKQNAPSASYKNKVVKNEQGTYIWVNNMGYARQFSTDAWARKSASCPTSSGTLNNNILASYPQGPAMGIGEKCSPVGINVQSSAGGGTAWVSPNGEKHPYSNFIDKNKSCPSAISTLTPTEYGAIPTGKSWTEKDSCDLLASSDKYSKVQQLNNELKSISAQMNQQVQVIVSKDNKVDKEVGTTKGQLVQKAKTLDIERQKIQRAITSILTSQGDLEDKHLETGSVNIHYFVWLLAFVTLGGIAVKQVLKS